MILEILFIITMFIPMVLAGILGAIPLFFVLLTFNVIFGLTEVIYVVKTKKTVSQHFWSWSVKHKGKAIIVLTLMAIMFGSLIWHLGYKMFQ